MTKQANKKPLFNTKGRAMGEKLGDSGLLVFKHFDPKELDEAGGICVDFRALDYKELSAGALDMIVGGQQSNSLWCSMYLGTLPWSPLTAQRSWIRFTQVIFINLTEVKRLRQPPQPSFFRKAQTASLNLFSQRTTWRRSGTVPWLVAVTPEGRKLSSKTSCPIQTKYSVSTWEYGSTLVKAH